MAKIALDQLRIENMILPMNSLKVEFTKDPKSCKSNAERARNTFIIVPDGRKFSVSTRFWISFGSLFNLGTNLFEYFSHAEVFDRLTEKKGDNVRITIEGVNGPTDAPIEIGTLLSCTGPGKPILRVEEVKTLVDLYSGDNALYESGIVQASFAAPFPQAFNIGGSEFTTRFMMLLPVDGYGLPAAYLELQRSNTHAVISGMTKAFKTQFQLGKDDTSLTPVLDRAMTTFNNEEGYHTFKLRLEAATKSWASFFEAGQLHDLLESVLTADGFELDQKSTILGSFNDTVGNPLAYYGVTGSNELSQRKAKTIPVKATMFDLFNFVTEVNTHYVTTRAGRQRLNEWIGQKIAEEFDLENTVETNPEFKDFFLVTTKGIIDPTSNVGERVLDLSDGGELGMSPEALEVPPPLDLPSGIVIDGETLVAAADAPPLPEGVLTLPDPEELPDIQATVSDSWEVLPPDEPPSSDIPMVAYTDEPVEVP